MLEIESSVPLDFTTISKFIGAKKGAPSPTLVIDVENSEYRGETLLLYLSNLSISSRFKSFDMPLEEKFDLLKSYMSMQKVCDQIDLTVEVADIILLASGVRHSLAKEPILIEEEKLRFIVDNYQLIVKWSLFLTSLIAYSIEVRANAKGVTVKDQFPQVRDPNYVGLSIVNLFRIPSFMEHFFSAGVSKSNILFFTYQFREYCFGKDKNLFSYFSFEENWLLANVLMVAGAYEGTNIQENFTHEVDQIIKGEDYQEPLEVSDNE